MDPKETSTYYAVLIAASVIGTIILYSIVSVIRLQRKHLRFYKAKLRAEVDTLEKERARVAADLHDDLGPTLSAIKFKIACIGQDPAENEKLAETSMQYIDDLLQQIRNISFDLMPIILIRNGLVPALQEFISQINESNKLKIEFDCDELAPVPQQASIHIYRILQEIIHNTLKHADASRLKIIMYSKTGRLYIATADDGKGFDMNKMTRESGMGLQNFRNRTEILSGEMYTKSYPSKGTQHFIEIPLQPRIRKHESFTNTN